MNACHQIRPIRRPGGDLYPCFEYVSENGDASRPRQVSNASRSLDMESTRGSTVRPMDTSSTAAPIAIGELSRQTGISIDTIRYYEHRGITPLPARTAAGRRRYDERSVDRLRFVARAKELGCTLDEIA